MPYLPYFFSVCTCVLLVINYFAQMLSFGRIYNRSRIVPPTVPVHLYELGDAGTLFANNQSK